MHFIASIDEATLLGCQIALTLIYAVVFLVMKRTYPYLRGAGSVAIAFFAATLANILLLFSDTLPIFITIVVSHCLLLSAFVLFYTGILHFFKSPRQIQYAWVITVVSTGWILYLVLTKDRTTALTYVIAISFFFLRGLMAIEVYRHAGGRLFLKIFAWAMAFYAVFALNRLIFLAVLHTPPTQAQRMVLQTISVLLSVAFAFLIGLSFLLMLCSELLTLVKDESERDHLCGVLNRRGIQMKLDSELRRAGRFGQTLSIALIDIDHFKTINDNAGHATGDSALRNTAVAISERLRPCDHIGRFGGDEFLLIFPEATSSEARNICTSIEQSIRALPVGRFGPPLTISIGVTQAVKNETADPLLARADKALYNAKNAGRNCTRVLLHELQTPQNLERLALPLEP